MYFFIVDLRHQRKHCGWRKHSNQRRCVSIFKFLVIIDLHQQKCQALCFLRWYYHCPRWCRVWALLLRRRSPASRRYSGRVGPFNMTTARDETHGRRSPMMHRISELGFWSRRQDTRLVKSTNPSYFIKYILIRFIITAKYSALFVLFSSI